MTYFLVCTISSLLVLMTTMPEFSSAQEQSEALFLTPYIESNQIIEAKRLSQVRNLSSTVTSYSGFITVDQTNGVNLFFWFFPAVEDPENAPVLLWSEGGPGITGLFSIFTEHGPFSLEADGNLTLRETTWTKNHSIIYLDQPIDVGYSFTDNEAGYVRSPLDIGPNTYKFLVQFFKLFPELQDNDFYNSGVSYGGIYAPVIAHYIHNQNQQNPEIRINLKGLLLETPLVDPVNQVDYGDYLYPLGLIDEEGLAHFREQSALIKSLVAEEKYEEAQMINLALVNPFGSSYSNLTGLGSTYNVIKGKIDDSYAYIFVAEPKIRKYLHVGNLTFSFVSPTVQNLFRPHMMRSVKTYVQDLLNWGYKTLIYAGQLDVSVCHTGVNAMIKTFQWDGAEEFANATRKIWSVNGSVAGYAKSARNFTHVLVRNAGHGAVGDQPVWVFDLLNKFTQGIDF